MASTLGWLDHDPHERERTNRILALFKERDARDELGLGGIRDSIADQLFPGTSTIQTRLRYMLFVPWIYQRLEEERAASTDVARKARRLETALVQPLLEVNEAGVLGRLARGDLKRLPSSVYWAGLGIWGIRRFDGAQESYHRGFDRLHALRAAARRRDDGDLYEGPKPTWDPALPPAPEGFPTALSFDLRRVEAEYLRDRICTQHPSSLLAWLIQDDPAPPLDLIWMHPRRARFRDAHRELVHHAHLFAQAMSGAATLYNLELARKHDRSELVQEHAEALEAWRTELAGPALGNLLLDWSLARFWELVVEHGHAISAGTRRFVEAWVGLTREGEPSAVDGELARRLVRERERLLKGTRSRFDNQRAADQWSGYAGLGPFAYRWPNTQRLLLDLFDGLQREHES